MRYGCSKVVKVLFEQECISQKQVNDGLLTTTLRNHESTAKVLSELKTPPNEDGIRAALKTIDDTLDGNSGGEKKEWVKEVISLFKTSLEWAKSFLTEYLEKNMRIDKNLDVICDDISSQKEGKGGSGTQNSTIGAMKNNQGNDGSIPEEILHSRTRNQEEQIDTTTKPVHQAISSSTHRYPEQSKDDWAELGRKNNGKKDEENRAKAASIQSWTIKNNQGNDGSILGKRLHETDQDQEEQIDTGRKVVLDQSWRKDPIQNEEVGMKHHG
jgi:hypothetical protein